VRQALDRLEAGIGGKAEQAAPDPAPRTEPARAAEPDPEPPAPKAAPEPSPPPPTNDDGGAVRLVAMKLALDGMPREEAHQQLAAEYDVKDLDSLLDEVYSKAGR
jgi:hypothetical protein